MPLLLLASLLPADASPPTDGVTPPEKADVVVGIEGEWEIVSVLEDGGKDITGRFQRNHFFITHDRFTVGQGPNGDADMPYMPYRLGWLKPIPEIDMPVHPDHASRGIYDCDGDHLVWGDAGYDNPRPKALSSKPGSGVHQLWTLRRVKK